MAAPSSWPRASLHRSASSGGRLGSTAPACSSRRMRSRSSAPAFSVKVMAAIEPQLGRPAGHEGDDPADERGGLAGAGARLDEQRRAEVVGDAVARGLVGRGGGGRGRHAGTASGASSSGSASSA